MDIRLFFVALTLLLGIVCLGKVSETIEEVTNELHTTANKR